MKLLTAELQGINSSLKQTNLLTVYFLYSFSIPWFLTYLLIVSSLPNLLTLFTKNPSDQNSPLYHILLIAAELWGMNPKRFKSLVKENAKSKYKISWILLKIRRVQASGFARNKKTREKNKKYFFSLNSIPIIFFYVIIIYEGIKAW